MLNMPSEGPCATKHPVVVTAKHAMINVSKAVKRFVNITNPFMVCIPKLSIVISYDELADF